MLKHQVYKKNPQCTLPNWYKAGGLVYFFDLPFQISVNVKRGLHVCRGLGTMENTSTKCPAQPSSPMSAVIQSVTQTSGARPWALRTPAEMETRDNIDKIKCTFIACQSRKITRLMKIFKAKQTSVFCFCLLSMTSSVNRSNAMSMSVAISQC